MHSAGLGPTQEVQVPSQVPQVSSSCVKLSHRHINPSSVFEVLRSAQVSHLLVSGLQVVQEGWQPMQAPELAPHKNVENTRSFAAVVSMLSFTYITASLNDPYIVLTVNFLL